MTIQDVGIKKQWWEACFRTMWSFNMYAVMLVIIWKGNSYFKAGDVTIGTLSTFVLYLTTIAFQFFKMSFVLGNLFMVFGAAERLTVIIDSKPTILTDEND